MSMIKAIVTDGKLVVEVPTSWPDGTEVQIQPVAETSQAEDGSLSPAEIARTLAVMRQLEPLEMTATEQANWEAQKRVERDWEQTHFDEHAQKLRSMWE